MEEIGVPENQPNGTPDKVEEMKKEDRVHLEKTATRLAAATEVGKCARCGQIHRAPRLRWTCSGCGDDICYNAAWPGDEFGRKDLNVHCLISSNPGKPDLKRVCGVLVPIMEPLPMEVTDA